MRGMLSCQEMCEAPACPMEFPCSECPQLCLDLERCHVLCTCGQIRLCLVALFYILRVEGKAFFLGSFQK